ncbi:MAG TPA: Lar family restriction alleviation protein [Arsenophonus apicola]|uniref:Lar family restriction alleviation protein n=1 Tax=Arsenophonus endosymbiont of Apis mellifera TaxID=1541805 RepID=UPI0015D7A1DB
MIVKTSELKDCPFCGSNDCLICTMNGTPTVRFADGYQALCLKCGVRTAWHSKRKEAVKIWNKRVDNE